jgi:hypothetical protein
MCFRCRARNNDPLNIFQEGNDPMKVSPVEKTADYAKKLAAGF